MYMRFAPKKIIDWGGTCSLAEISVTPSENGLSCMVRESSKSSAQFDPSWSPRQESNLHLALRRRPFYPLNYGG